VSKLVLAGSDCTAQIEEDNKAIPTNLLNSLIRLTVGDVWPTAQILAIPVMPHVYMYCTCTVCSEHWTLIMDFVNRRGIALKAT